MANKSQSAEVQRENERSVMREALEETEQLRGWQNGCLNSSRAGRIQSISTFSAQRF
jgi:hypothetical protein